ncbi:hypothetical protein LUZ60_011242 [Juncus effusus]|nr:hypothetical protein LUZ60_011242 [Juncus effusus]
MAQRLVGVERFYSPPAVRRQQQLLELELQQRAALEQVKAEAASAEEEACSSKQSPDPSASNLDRFLESTTPSVRAQYWPKLGVKGYRNGKSTDECYYYNLNDLWESFKEWSAYGAGVPILLDGNESVVQYYVPYLSAIQLYSNTTRSSKQRNGEESDSSNSSSSSSEESRERESVRFNESDSCTVPAPVPVFEYLAKELPYTREPLADKISKLAKDFPDLKAYRSCDLLPSSWFSVAWYPIYRIPTGPTLKDLETCFLTFHSLSTPKSINNSTNRPTKLSLPTFGLASYKLKTNIWTNEELDEIQVAASLLEAADNWLRLVHVDHPDFQFFVNHYNTTWR